MHYKVGKRACTDCLIMHRVKATGKFALLLARKCSYGSSKDLKQNILTLGSNCSKVLRHISPLL